MPYGLPRDIGGDSPANDALMERCIVKVMRDGHGKESAIRICKASLIRAKRKKKE